MAQAHINIPETLSEKNDIYHITQNPATMRFLKTITKQMERPVLTEEKLYHQHLFRLDDDLNVRLLNHMEEDGFSLSGIVRRSLQLFLDKGNATHNGESITQKNNHNEI
jgi:hypothetical protein